MTNPRTRTVSLPVAEPNYVDSLVASGAYTSASEVVRAGLRALQEREAAIERWLEDEVVPVCEAIWRDPSRALSGDDERRGRRRQHDLPASTWDDRDAGLFGRHVSRPAPPL